MTRTISGGPPGPAWFTFLRAAGVAATCAGGVGSVVFTVFAGRHTAARILLPLFGAWVISPFVVLVLAHVLSRRWSVSTRAVLSCVMLVVAAASLAIYGAAAVGAARIRTPIFVVVPPLSWLFIAVVTPVTARLAGHGAAS